MVGIVDTRLLLQILFPIEPSPTILHLIKVLSQILALPGCMLQWVRLYAHTSEVFIQQIWSTWFWAEGSWKVVPDGKYLRPVSQRIVSKNIACVCTIVGAWLAELLGRLACPIYDSASRDKSLIASNLTTQASAREANTSCIILPTRQIDLAVEGNSVSRDIIRVLLGQQVGKFVIIELTTDTFCGITKAAKCPLRSHSSKGRLEHPDGSKNQIWREPHFLKNSAKKEPKSNITRTESLEELLTENLRPWRKYGMK